MKDMRITPRDDPHFWVHRCKWIKSSGVHMPPRRPATTFCL